MRRRPRWVCVRAFLWLLARHFPGNALAGCVCARFNQLASLQQEDDYDGAAIHSSFRGRFS